MYIKCHMSFSAIENIKFKKNMQYMQYACHPEHGCELIYSTIMTLVHSIEVIKHE